MSTKNGGFIRYKVVAALLFWIAVWPGAYPASAQFPSYRIIPAQYELVPAPLNTKEDFGLFNDATEDKEGFIWLSGTKGIFAYDGYQLVHYANRSAAFPLNPDAPQGNFFNITKDQTGLLYIANSTYYSILCFNPFTRKFQYELTSRRKKNGGLLLLSVCAPKDMLVLDIDNDKNIGTVCKVQGQKNANPVYTNKILPLPYAETFLQFCEGYHWFINYRRIIRISADGSSTKAYELPDKNAFVAKVYTDAGHLFLLDDKARNIYTWDKSTDQFIVYLHLPAQMSSPSSNYQFAVKEDIVYLANSLEFYIIDKKTGNLQDLSAGYISLTQAQSAANQGTELARILIASNKNVYLIRQDVICQLKKKLPSSELFREKGRFPSAYLVTSFRGMAEDEHKNIYASYYNSISRKAAGSNMFVPLPAARALKSEVVSTYDLNYRKNYLFWNNIRIDLRSNQHRFLGHTGLSRHTTQYLDGDTLWFYPWGSGILYRYNLLQDHLDSFNLDKKLGEEGEVLEELNAMVSDASRRNLWLATKGNGIALITKRGKLIRKYRARELGLQEDATTINALRMTPEGLWFGCSAGLGLLHPVTGKTTVYSDPSSHNMSSGQSRDIISILPDTAGNFYLGCNKGIAYFDTRKKTFFNLPENHPLEEIECNRNAAFRTSDNHYYFGSTNGLYSFTPGELHFFNSSIPIKPIKLYHITIYNSSKKQYSYLAATPDPGKALMLDPFDNNVTFELSVPEFNHNIYYSYRVKGYNEVWTEYNQANNISLYNLQPGNYTLEVKASTDRGNVNASFYRLSIIMKQVWYKKIWVIMLVFLTAIAAAVLIVRTWFRQKLKRQKELTTLRTKISMDLHDDVGSVLSGLAMQSEMLMYTAAEAQKEPLREISSLSREALEQMRDIVWSMDNRKDKYENLVDRAKAFANRSLARSNMTYEFVTEGIPPGKFISPEKRQTIYLIFKEALTNILKHSDATHVAIKLTKGRDDLQLVIHDNGSKVPHNITDGTGLNNMKERAERCGGICTAKYEQGFLITVKLNI